MAAAVFEAYRATSYPRVAQQNRSLAWRRANTGEKLPVMARAQKARVRLYKQIYNPCARLFLSPNHHRLPSTSVCLPWMPAGTREQNRETDADHAKGQSRPVPMWLGFIVNGLVLFWALEKGLHLPDPFKFPSPCLYNGASDVT